MSTRLRAVWRLLPAVVLAACASADGPPRDNMQPGVWSGDLTWDSAQSPVGVAFEAGADGNVRMLDAPFYRFDVVTDTVRVAGDTVRFSLPTGDPHRECVLIARGPGLLEGPCGPAADPWTLRLAAPGEREKRFGISAWLLERASLSWRTVEGARVSVHAAPDAPDSLDLRSLATSADSAVVANLQFLGAADYVRPLDLFLLRDRAELEAHIGRAHGGYSDSFGNATLVTGYGDSPTVIQHEIMHVMSHNLWGGVHGARDWMREGVATAAPGTCQRWGLQGIAARMQHDAILLPLDALVERFREQNDIIAYLQAGALIQHMATKHGADAVRALWQGGPASLRDHTGLSLEQVDADWRAGLPASLAAGAGFTLDAIRGIGCH